MMALALLVAAAHTRRRNGPGPSGRAILNQLVRCDGRGATTRSTGAAGKWPTATAATEYGQVQQP